MSCYCSCATGGRCPSVLFRTRPSLRPSVLLLSYLTADYRASERTRHVAQMGALREGDPEPESTGGQADDAQGRGGEGGVVAFCEKCLKVMQLLTKKCFCLACRITQL